MNKCKCSLKNKAHLMKYNFLKDFFLKMSAPDLIYIIIF
jgi:hypothetical protein